MQYSTQNAAQCCSRASHYGGTSDKRKANGAVPRSFAGQINVLLKVVNPAKKRV